MKKAEAGFQEYFLARASTLSDVIPKSRALTAEKLIKGAVAVIHQNPKLKDCTPGSVFMALLQAAELGLEPTGTTGGAHLVPFKGTCQLIIGYRGLCDLARRSGALKAVEARVVHEEDEFDLVYGFNPILFHRPFMKGEPGKVLGFYCIILSDGEKHVDHMTLKEVEKIRDRIPKSTEYASSPWAAHFEEMGKKTILRRTMKLIPMTSELQRATEIDDASESAIFSRSEERDENVVELDHRVLTTGNDRLKSQLRSRSEKAAAETEVINQDVGELMEQEGIQHA